jgi:hypothetical protein
LYLLLVELVAKSRHHVPAAIWRALYDITYEIDARSRFDSHAYWMRPKACASER